MTPQSSTFRCRIGIRPRDRSRFQGVIIVADSKNIYSVLPSTLLEMIGVSTEWESPFTLPSGS